MRLILRFENIQVNLTNKNGQNSLYYAQKNQSEEMISLLISNGAKQRTPSNKYIKSNSFSRQVINEAIVSWLRIVSAHWKATRQCVKISQYAFAVNLCWPTSQFSFLLMVFNDYHDNITWKTSFIARFEEVWCSKAFKQTTKSGWKDSSLWLNDNSVSDK